MNDYIILTFYMSIPLKRNSRNLLVVIREKSTQTLYQLHTDLLHRYEADNSDDLAVG